MREGRGVGCDLVWSRLRADSTASRWVWGQHVVAQDFCRCFLNIQHLSCENLAPGFWGEKGWEPAYKLPQSANSHAYLRYLLLTYDRDFETGTKATKGHMQSFHWKIKHPTLPPPPPLPRDSRRAGPLLATRPAGLGGWGSLGVRGEGGQEGLVQDRGWPCLGHPMQPLQDIQTTR